MDRLTLDEAATSLLRGEVVVVPTDTVYGVAARLHDAAAVRRLFEVKSRPLDVALPVLVGSLEDVEGLGVEWPSRAHLLAETFWPGALTIVVPAPPEVAQLVGARNTLGIRWPRHDMLSALVRACGALTVTSANEHAHPPCTNVLEVLATKWAAPVAGVLDGGACDAPVSSVVEINPDGWRLRRLGALSRTELEEVLGPELPTRDQ